MYAAGEFRCSDVLGVLLRTSTSFRYWRRQVFLDGFSWKALRNGIMRTSEPEATVATPPPANHLLGRRPMHLDLCRRYTALSAAGYNTIAIFNPVSY